MKRLLLGVLVLSALVPWWGRRIPIVYAQVPATLTATWNPNAAAENVVDYQLWLDTGPPQLVPPSVCTATLCTQTFVVGSFGVHTIHLTARALVLDTDPTSFVSSAPPVDVTFRLSAPPTTPRGLGVKQK